MATIKSFSDLPQSKKLAEILPPETADMSYPYNRNLNKMYGDIPYVMGYKKFNKDTDIPCWSLAALLDVLPKIHGLKPILDLEECSIQYSGIDLYIIASNPVDTCVNTIIKLHELNLL